MQQLRSFNDIKTIALKNGWAVNPDEKVVSMIIKRENDFIEKFGHPYCPCKKEKSNKNICPCTEAAEEIKLTGHCHCLLFFK